MTHFLLPLLNKLLSFYNIQSLSIKVSNYLALSFYIYINKYSIWYFV